MAAWHGKTHLMHAIGHTIKEAESAMRLSYVSAEKFTIEVINSLRFDRMISFRDRFHTWTLLLVDDIQFHCGQGALRRKSFFTRSTRSTNSRNRIRHLLGLPAKGHQLHRGTAAFAVSNGD